MRGKLHSFSSITLAALIGVSLVTSSAIAAEKKKKSAAKDVATQSQTSNQQTQSVESTAPVKKAKWEQEPASFMGIELGQPLSKSVSTECPKARFGNVDERAAEGLGRLCHNDYILKGGAGSYSVYGFQVPPIFKAAYIKTLDGRLDGAVGTFQASFNSGDFSQVMEMLIIKYGSPHKKEVEKLKTNGGAEFDNIVLSWSGENVLIKVESLSARGFNGSSLFEWGVINVHTTEYLTKKSQSSSEAAQKGATGL